MSKPKKRIDAAQMSLFDCDSKIEEYAALKAEILNAPPARNEREDIQSWEEDCIEIAAAVKRAIKQSGLSREEIVDAVNRLYGWTPPAARKGKKARKGLSIHMFNHYLSKPASYPIPAFYLFAIMRITNSLAPCVAFAEAEGAQVISGDEVRQMRLGKLDDTLIELQRLKKALREKR
jgi:hypothetical protein